jgi:RNA polymerase sigma-70 factor (ECF subfamily)
VVQESFLALWEHKDNVNTEKVKSWLFTTAYRNSLKLLQRQKNYASEEYLASIESRSVINPDVKSLINKGLELLSELQKSALMLKDYEGFSYQEIAEILKISEASVKVHLFRAREKMRNYIGDLNVVL